MTSAAAIGGEASAAASSALRFNAERRSLIPDSPSRTCPHDAGVADTAIDDNAPRGGASPRDTSGVVSSDMG